LGGFTGAQFIEIQPPNHPNLAKFSYKIFCPGLSCAKNSSHGRHSVGSCNLTISPPVLRLKLGIEVPGTAHQQRRSAFFIFPCEEMLFNIPFHAIQPFIAENTGQFYANNAENTR